MGVKTKFDQLISQVESVENLIQQVTVVGKKDQFLQKLQEI